MIYNKFNTQRQGRGRVRLQRLPEKNLQRLEGVFSVRQDGSALLSFFLNGKGYVHALFFFPVRINGARC
ncbi:MAG: hypothetical protein GX263_09490 [Firmicutes bacterium]|nr:hypothetical protein [Bacillota bacterium]